jgi:hypothetical protein
MLETAATWSTSNACCIPSKNPSANIPNMLARFPSSSRLIATSHRVEIAQADAKTVPLRNAFPQPSRLFEPVELQKGIGIEPNLRLCAATET